MAALLSGEIDFLLDPPFQDLDRLKKNENLKVGQIAQNRSIFFGLDQASNELRSSNIKGKNPFKDKRVGQAMHLAIDSNAIHKVIMRGLSQPANVITAPMVHGYPKDLDKRPPQDLQKAKKLLAEAGYPNGFEVKLDCPNNRYNNDEKICQAAVAMLGKAGIKVNLDAQSKTLHFGVRRGSRPHHQEEVTMQSRLLTIVGLALVAGACSGTGAKTAWQGTVTDSAGVAIVQNPTTGLWDAADAWTVTEQLRVGAAEGEPEYQFGMVVGMAVAKDGRIAVLDQQGRHVKLFGADGKYLTTIGKPGGGPGELGPGVTFVMIDPADTLFVADLQNQRVNLYLLDGPAPDPCPPLFQCVIASCRQPVPAAVACHPTERR